MSSQSQHLSYRRQGGLGTLQLRGVVDIFEAAEFYELAKRACQDTKAQSIRVNLAQVERLDISALQILIALRRDIEASGRALAIADVPAPLAQVWAKAGIPL